MRWVLVQRSAAQKKASQAITPFSLRYGHMWDVL
jgi:hypothetical protein